MKYFLPVIALLFFSACTSSSNESSDKVMPELIPEYKALLDAHGDWLKWYNASAESYSMIHEVTMTEEDAFVNMNSRKIRVSNSEFEMGFDGEQTWISPNREAYRGPSVKFYHNLYFYFYNIPFVFTDKGVKVEKVEDRTLNGKKYPTLKASFDSGTGASSKDQYFMLINPETNRLEYLLYTVTYFDSPNPELNALKYDDYREADGVFFPRTLTGYTYKNDSTQAVKYQVSFANLLLLDDPFGDDIFEKPENGVYAD